MKTLLTTLCYGLIVFGILALIVSAGTYSLEQTLATRHLEAETRHTQAQVAAVQAQTAATQAQAVLTHAEGERAILEAAAASVAADRQLINVITLSAASIVISIIGLCSTIVILTLKHNKPCAAPTPDNWQIIALFLASVLRERAAITPSTAAERHALRHIKHQTKIHTLTE